MVKSRRPMGRIFRWTCLLMAPSLIAGGSLTGHGRFERVKGQPQLGYVELYEWNLFVSPDAPGLVGPFRRLGAPPGQVPTGDGYYRIDNLPAGTYSVYVNQPDFFASPRVVPNVVIHDGAVTELNVELDVDYSCCSREDGWTDWGPWDWYQTFRANGTAVRGVSWRMAGSGLYNGKTARIRILEDTGQADVRQWRQVGIGTDGQLRADSDEWVRWPSGQVPLIPGKTYAVNVHIDGGLAVYKRDKDADSYPHGRAYDGDGNPKNFDLYMVVFVDKHHQRVTHTRRSSGPGNLAPHGATSWGQTFIAHGTSLAAVDLFQANGVEPTFELTWTIRRNGPTGPQIGPEKTVQSAYFAAGADLSGVSFQPGQVPLTPGQRYYIGVRNPQGRSFTAFYQESWNRYGDGQAYRNGTALPGEDLAMTIVEYTHPPQSETGLAAWWPVDRLDDGTIQDAGGLQRHGTVQGDPVIVDGVRGGALQMNGDDAVVITGYQGITGSAPRTCALWARFPPGNTDSILLRWGSPEPGGLWQLRLIPIGGQPRLRLAVGGGYIQTRTVIDTGRWTHLAVVLPDDASHVQDVRIYIDGLRQPPDALEFRAHSIDTGAGEDVRLGTNGQEFLDGVLDDVVLCDVALTDAQVARLYTLGPAAFLQPCGGARLDPGVTAAGDIDCDCTVDLRDLAFVSHGWLQTGTLAADVNLDQTVDAADLRILANDWLQSVGPDSP